jgi:hypothetical protein
MYKILAIDPGTTQSAYVIFNPEKKLIEAKGIEPNEKLLEILKQGQSWGVDYFLAIEMVQSFGMPVGAEVFETVYWVGRFWQAREDLIGKARVKRGQIKIHHCGSMRAKDGNIAQALIDKYAPGVRNKGKGLKSSPGFFYGFRADLWQAFALAAYIAENDIHTASRLAAQSLKA